MRYLLDFGAEVLELQGTVTGLGAHAEVSLTRTEVLGRFVYDSDRISIDPLASGEFVVTVDAPLGVDDDGSSVIVTEVETYRTLDRDA